MLEAVRDRKAHQAVGNPPPELGLARVFLVRVELEEIHRDGGETHHVPVSDCDAWRLVGFANLYVVKAPSLHYRPASIRDGRAMLASTERGDSPRW